MSVIADHDSTKRDIIGDPEEPLRRSFISSLGSRMFLWRTENSVGLVALGFVKCSQRGVVPRPPTARVLSSNPFNTLKLNVKMGLLRVSRTGTYYSALWAEPRPVE